MVSVRVQYICNSGLETFFRRIAPAERIRRFFLVLFFVLTLSSSTLTFAAHPLITDDTGTQGEGKFQIEVNGEFARDEKESVAEEATELGIILSYGVLDNADVVMTAPYLWVQTEEPGSRTTENGVSDLAAELKWRFYERASLSFALKPGITLPTGDDERGLGAGRPILILFFLTTYEIPYWAFHLNLGYIRNENKIDERENLWHASLAAEVEITEKLQAVGNIGVEKNPDSTAGSAPAFILGGLIYSLTKDFDLDFGIKAGLTESEADYSILAGFAWKF